MVFYLATVLVQYAIAFGLALLLNAEIRARRFFRVAFLLPFMLSPVAVSWMIGKSIMEYRFGPAATLARQLGWDSPAFYAYPWVARLSIMAMNVRSKQTDSTKQMSKPCSNRPAPSVSQLRCT